MLRSKVLATIAAFIVNRKAIQRIAFRTISKTGIQYRKSTLSKRVDRLPDTASQVGDRFLASPTRVKTWNFTRIAAGSRRARGFL
jgi:hypothetical protein